MQYYFKQIQIGMVTSVDPDQTAPIEAVWSGFALFTKTCLS